MAFELIQRLLGEAAKLSDEELRQVLVLLGADYKIRLKRADAMAAMMLRPGDWVENARPGRKLPVGAKGHVIEIRRSGRVEVHFPEHGVWTMDASLVRKIPTPPRATAGPEAASTAGA